jgi:NhaA family Na+:H+ antiporter
LALAIVDDIGAILVIAVFYARGISVFALLVAAACLALTLLCRWLGVRSVGIYAMIGIAIWLAMFYSGIHPTIAGVLLGLLTPAKPTLQRRTVLEELMDAVVRLPEDDQNHTHGQVKSIGRLKSTMTESISPLERLETALHPWVAFLIMPLFALANAGVLIRLDAFTNNVAIAVMIGLGLGKPLGIVLFSWLAVRGGLAKLPAGVSWGVLTAGGVLAGIGFTMSIFIAGLAFSDDLLDAAKIGVLSGSAMCGVLGITILVYLLRSEASATNDELAQSIRQTS